MIDADKGLHSVQTHSFSREAIFEIGRRLKHVKENDLAHGQWERWLREEVEIHPRVAQMHMKVADTPGLKTRTSSQMGLDALYLIATLPPEERTRGHTLKSGETKPPDEMTVRELREVKAAYSISSNTRISIAGGCVSSSNSSGSSGSILRLASARASVLLAVCGEDTPMASAISLSVRPSSRSLSAVSSRSVSVSAEGAVAGRNFPSADSTFPTVNF
ncbi:MAG: DUF3102 domain-containing protein [Paenibacillus macerans]|uniref:DUF3102 domain-containing protein n=1 Tax=Paenibacillus TaxID=44249 RepID=UPI002913C999|nr:DUF3102 domain-containing protein [Paenibacillus macerans]MDU7472117.1 DUF3102 domain-containing protein [Paenibacillus macerans]